MCCFSRSKPDKNSVIESIDTLKVAIDTLPKSDSRYLNELLEIIQARYHYNNALYDFFKNESLGNIKSFVIEYFGISSMDDDYYEKMREYFIPLTQKTMKEYLIVINFLCNQEINQAKDFLIGLKQSVVGHLQDFEKKNNEKMKLYLEQLPNQKLKNTFIKKMTEQNLFVASSIKEENNYWQECINLLKKHQRHEEKIKKQPVEPKEDISEKPIVKIPNSLEGENNDDKKEIKEREVKEKKELIFSNYPKRTEISLENQGPSSLDNEYFSNLADLLKNHYGTLNAVFSVPIPHYQLTFRALQNLIEKIPGGSIEKKGGSRRRIRIQNVVAETHEPCEEISTKDIKQGGVHKPHKKRGAHGHTPKKVSRFIVKLFRSALERAQITPANLWPESSLKKNKLKI